MRQRKRNIQVSNGYATPKQAESRLI